MEPPQNEVQSVIAPLKKVTPLSKYLAMALFVVLPFLGAYVGYTIAPEKVVEVTQEIPSITPDAFVTDNSSEFFPSSVYLRKTQEMDGSESAPLPIGKLHTDNQLGVSFEIPQDWLISNAEMYSGSKAVGIEIKSPDLQLGQKFPDRPILMGTQMTLTAESLEGKYDESLWQPEAYLEWEENLKTDCSNCIMVERIKLGEQIAILSVYENVNELPDTPVGGHTVQISLVHNGQVYLINYASATSNRYREVLKRFVETFEFI
jgi:hypothetical protein